MIQLFTFKVVNVLFLNASLTSAIGSLFASTAALGMYLISVVFFVPVDASQPLSNSMDVVFFEASILSSSTSASFVVAWVG